MNLRLLRESGVLRPAVGFSVRAAVLCALIGPGSGCSAVRNYHADVRLRRGDALLASDRLDAALAEFEAAARLAPQKPEPHSRLGTIYKTRGSLEKAIGCFVEALRRNPVSFDDTFHLAQLYQLTERVADAIRAYLYAIELRPEDFDTQVNLGVCYQRSGQLDQAVARFQKAIEVEPDRPHAYINLGVALDAQERYYEAIRAYKEALERDQNQPLVLVNLARTYMHQDRLRIAKEALRQAIVMEPGFAGAHESLGYCLFRLREFDEAESFYKRALLYDWRLPRAHAGLGSINMLRHLKDEDEVEARDQALEYWHRSLELDPNQPRLRRLLATYTPTRGDPEEILGDQGAVSLVSP